MQNLISNIPFKLKFNIECEIDLNAYFHDLTSISLCIFICYPSKLFYTIRCQSSSMSVEVNMVWGEWF